MMIISPFQLLHSNLLKVRVDQSGVKTRPASSMAATSDMEEFELEHMCQIKLQRRKPATNAEAIEGETKTFNVLLGIRTPDESTINIPYSFEIVVAGVISASSISEKSDEEHNDMAAQYGYSLLYGQIRETLAGITSRMRGGTFVLPTMSFMGAKFPVSNEAISEKKIEKLSKNRPSDKSKGNGLKRKSGDDE